MKRKSEKSMTIFGNDFQEIDDAWISWWNSRTNKGTKFPSFYDQFKIPQGDPILEENYHKACKKLINGFRYNF